MRLPAGLKKNQTNAHCVYCNWMATTSLSFLCPLKHQAGATRVFRLSLGKFWRAYLNKTLYLIYQKYN